MKDTTAIAVASTLILGYKADLSNDIYKHILKPGLYISYRFREGMSLLFTYY
jgi:Na+(H+)/acetate symporter ActP